MKDLIKGHNPLMLFFVALMSLFFAFAVRNKIVGEGHTDLNANFFFFMVLASCIGIYFLIHEGIKEFTDFFYNKSWKKHGIVPQTASEPMPIIQDNKQCVKEEVKSENPPLTREDARMLLTEILAIKTEKASESPEVFDKHINDNFLDISNVASSAADEIETGLQNTFREGCIYTVEMLGSYLSTDDMKKLITRLAKFQRASGDTWIYLSKDETTNIKVDPYSPIDKIDLYHYGWNMQQLFGKSGTQAAFFLQTTFHHHFDDLLLKTIKGKLTLDPQKGIIKIDKEFSPNYRSRLAREKEKNIRQMTKEAEEKQKQEKFEKQSERREKAEERYRQQQANQEKQSERTHPKKETNSRPKTDDEKAYDHAAKYNGRELEGVDDIPEDWDECA